MPRLAPVEVAGNLVGVRVRVRVRVKVRVRDEARIRWQPAHV